MLRWETRDGEKGRFANGARASYRITTTRTYTGPTYRLTRRERVSGPWTFMGLFNFLAEARGAADIHENA